MGAEPNHEPKPDAGTRDASGGPSSEPSEAPDPDQAHTAVVGAVRDAQLETISAALGERVIATGEICRKHYEGPHAGVYGHEPLVLPFISVAPPPDDLSPIMAHCTVGALVLGSGDSVHLSSQHPVPIGVARLSRALHLVQRMDVLSIETLGACIDAAICQPTAQALQAQVEVDRYLGRAAREQILAVPVVDLAQRIARVHAHGLIVDGYELAVEVERGGLQRSAIIDEAMARWSRHAILSSELSPAFAPAFDTLRATPHGQIPPAWVLEAARRYVDKASGLVEEVPRYLNPEIERLKERVESETQGADTVIKELGVAALNVAELRAIRHSASRMIRASAAGEANVSLEFLSYTETLHGLWWRLHGVRATFFAGAASQPPSSEREHFVGLGRATEHLILTLDEAVMKHMPGVYTAFAD